MTTLYYRHILEGVHQGVPVQVKHGAATDPFVKPLSITGIDRVTKIADNALAANTAIAVYSSSVPPAAFDYLMIWTSAAAIVQFIGASSHFTLRLLATAPLFLGSDQISIAANTTAISSDPTEESIATIYLYNPDDSATLSYQVYTLDVVA